MSPSNETTWSIEPHTAAKHLILEVYLKAWFPILQAVHKRVVYIDGFSGPGKYVGGQDGSPIIAVKQALNSRNLERSRVDFLFLEEDNSRCSSLRAIFDEWRGLPQNVHVQIENAGFEEHLSRLLDDLDQSGMRNSPTFAFVDPFGFSGIPMQLLGRLLRNSHTEVLVNFMAGFVNRFVEHPDDKIIQHIRELFGIEGSISPAATPTLRREQLRDLYQTQLRKHARFVRHFEMRNSTGQVIYYLFFASNHPLGHVKIKEAFWKVDPQMGFVFSDKTDPLTTRLFEIDPNPTVKEILVNRYVGRHLHFEEARDFIENDTAYLVKHLRAALRSLEDEGKIQVEPTKVDGSNRRRGTFPEGTAFTF